MNTSNIVEKRNLTTATSSDNSHTFASWHNKRYPIKNLSFCQITKVVKTEYISATKLIK